MKFTISWLKDYLETTATLQDISNKLTGIGLEVEEITDKAKVLEYFSAAQIIKAIPHPDSNKLKICQVDVGDKTPLQIICGASNARDGLKVAYAPIGSIIPANGMKIKKSKIAGVESFGMLCSAEELGLGADGEGIIEIDQRAAIGTKIADLYGLNEAVLTINITPNRSDCLGIYGIARDLAATAIGTLKKPQVKAFKGEFASPVKVGIDSTSCTYFSGRYIKNITNIKSPQWLSERLEAIGINSISAVVDITNYVMFCLGQPLHCYDADKISGNITIREAKENEEFISLQNQKYQLTCQDLVVADNHSVIALAGIIGSLSSCSTTANTNIFLEAAYFDPQSIAKTGRKLNILSDARYRFERNIDLTTVKTALDMATNLILEICGGQVSEVVEAGSSEFAPVTINFHFDKIAKFLGTEIPENEVIKILERLGFKLTNTTKNSFTVTVPSYRNDVRIPEDLIEEIIRIYGYNNIVARELLPPDKSNMPYQNNLDMLRNILCISGLDETISWSFISTKFASLFSEINPGLIITNPISQDMGYMRPSLLPGLILAARKNKLRGFDNLSFFEIGKIFLDVDPNQQKQALAGIRIGKNKERNHYKDERSYDVMDVKKDFFDCLEFWGISARSVQLTDEVPAYYHPHRAAAVKLGKNIIGYFGELSPVINKKMDITGRINAFELFLDNLPAKNPKKSSFKKTFKALDFQAVHRDFAFIIDEKIKVDDLIRAVENCDRELISKVNIFDIYQGDNIPGEKKSIALGIEIQPVIKTLTSEEIDQISTKIISIVISNYGGTLRSN